jgi:hypothetical protein
MTIPSFKIDIPQATLDDLRERLGRTRWPDSFYRFHKIIPLLTDPPRELGERFLCVARWTEMPRGGHFAALEVPELLVEDIRSFLHSLRSHQIMK